VAPPLVGCSSGSDGTAVRCHGLEGEPFIVRDTFTCELDGAGAGDSEADTIATSTPKRSMISRTFLESR
jgi:hypothetical protein